MECGEKVYKLWEQLLCSPAWHWETTMCTCITCRQIFAEIFCGMLAFGVSTKSWNWENVSFLKWTAWIKGHHQLQDFFSNSISYSYWCFLKAVHVIAVSEHFFGRYQKENFGLRLLFQKSQDYLLMSKSNPITHTQCIKAPSFTYRVHWLKGHLSINLISFLVSLCKSKIEALIVCGIHIGQSKHATWIIIYAYMQSNVVDLT